MTFEFDVPGMVEGLHSVDGITAVEYTKGGDTHYRVLVDGEDTEVAVNSLAHAIVFGIAYRFEGPDTAADVYFLRMISAVEEDDE